MTKGQSRHEEIAGDLRDRILSGELKPGNRAVSSLDAAAAEHHVAVGTIREALRLLASEGLVVTQPGIGTIVQDPGANGTKAAAGTISPAEFRKLQEDVADLKADVAELQSRSNINRAARKQVRANEQSG